MGRASTKHYLRIIRKIVKQNLRDIDEEMENVRKEEVETFKNDSIKMCKSVKYQKVKDTKTYIEINAKNEKRKICAFR